MSASDARFRGFRPRTDHEIIEQNTPWMHASVSCLTCGHSFCSVHMIGTPFTDLECTFCGGHDIVESAEAPLFLPIRH